MQVLAISLVFLLLLFLVLRYQKKPIFSESFDSLLDSDLCHCGCLQRGRFREGCPCPRCPFRRLGYPCGCGCMEKGRKLRRCMCPNCPFMRPQQQEENFENQIEGFNENETPREELPLGVDSNLAEAAGIKSTLAYPGNLLGRLCRPPCRIRQPNCSGDPYAQPSEDHTQWRGERYYLPQETLSGQDENLWVPTEPGYKV